MYYYFIFYFFIVCVWMGGFLCTVGVFRDFCVCVFNVVLGVSVLLCEFFFFVVFFFVCDFLCVFFIKGLSRSYIIDTWRPYLNNVYPILYNFFILLMKCTFSSVEFTVVMAILILGCSRGAGYARFREHLI